MSAKALQQGWQKITQRGNLAHWQSLLQLQGVRANPKREELLFSLSGKSCIPAKELADLKQALQEEFKDWSRVEVAVVYPDMGDALRNDLPQYAPQLAEGLSEKLPSARVWLAGADWKSEGNKLIVQVHNPAGRDFLRDCGGAQALEEIVKSQFGCEMRVEFTCDCKQDEAIAQHEELQKQATAQLLSQTLKEARKKPEKKKGATPSVIYGNAIKTKPIPMRELAEDSGTVCIEGEIIGAEVKDLRNGKQIINFDMTDYTNSFSVKLFVEPNSGVQDHLKPGSYVRVKGPVVFDKFQRETVIMANDIGAAEAPVRLDTAPVKRVELHLHTQMSSMDALTPVKDLFKQAHAWGHDAVAITDHGVVQAFPDAYAAAKANGMKAIFGVEGYLVDDAVPIVRRPGDKKLETETVVFDIETTGLSVAKCGITEIGAVKVRDGEIIDRFSTFTNPGRPIPPNIVKLTGITDEMVAAAPDNTTVVRQFLDFCGDAALCAHNAPFDVSFIRHTAKQNGWGFEPTVIDTLTLARNLYPELRSHKLNIVADHLGVSLENHHRAVHDAEATALILLRQLQQLKEMGLERLSQVNGAFSEQVDTKKLPSYHIVLLVENQEGLQNLYKLVSASHLKYYHRRPRIPRTLLQRLRGGLIVGSACQAGELFKAFLNGEDDDCIAELAEFYDYYEIQPDANNAFLVREGTLPDFEALHEINKRIIALGEKYRKPVVATGDVHFLHPHDAEYRAILTHGMGFDDADEQSPLYFKSTDQMLEEFSYLGQEEAMRVVVHAPRAIADKCASLKPYPDDLHAPRIDGADDDIREMATKKAHEIYGEVLPEIVEKRLKKELDAIINNGFAVLYLIAHKLVKKSLDDHYLVGSRGSVGSSFVATMCDITEVNPLPPHYICPNCKHCEFVHQEGMADITGVDLPDAVCPECGTPYKKQGYGIPFEVFLGFKGDKVPDIDLNFSGVYQPTAHKYVEELFGSDHVFRAGTIATIAEKTAYGYVRKYLEDKGRVALNAEINRLVKGCAGVKRTTGQHPGGIIVVPKDRDIHEFTAVQRPADDVNSGTITTHFDFNSLHDRLVKLDILGHDDPTSIRMLEDLTGINAREIPLDDPKTMQIFSSTEPLGISPEDIDCPVGTFGIPEFGTRFVRQMLVETKPTTMAELVRISGLSHGTDVWTNNAQDLIRDGVCSLNQCICTRDDIMNQLMNYMDSADAFAIMESVRKGKGLVLKRKDGAVDMEPKMREAGVPEWFIDSCKKIKYMFPKAHAVAYVTMGFRIAYCKVNYPKAFYATYFTVRADEFEAGMVTGGIPGIKAKIKEFDGRNGLSPREKSILTMLEISLEMYCRGIQFLPVDLYASDATEFLIEEGGIRLPFTAIPGLGANAAQSVVEERKNGKFISIEEIQRRTKLSRSVLEVMEEMGCLGDLPKTSQVTLF